jgi:hypothetical protein
MERKPTSLQLGRSHVLLEIDARTKGPDDREQGTMEMIASLADSDALRAREASFDFSTLVPSPRTESSAIKMLTLNDWPRL